MVGDEAGHVNHTPPADPAPQAAQEGNTGTRTSDSAGNDQAADTAGASENHHADDPHRGAMAMYTATTPIAVQMAMYTAT
jgi:hypothetical protein